jgi:hypothetical protein
VTGTSIASLIHFLGTFAYSKTGAFLRRVHHALRDLLSLRWAPSLGGGVSASALTSPVTGTRLVYGDVDVISCSSRLLS